MTRELNLLRYGLIIVPAFFTMYIYQYADYGIFTLHILMLLFLVVMVPKLPRSFHALISIIEVLFTAWLCYQYGSIMIFPAISALLYYSRLQPQGVPLVFTIVHLITLNVALWDSPQLLVTFINITFLLIAYLNELLQRAGRGREDTLHLYDELRKKHFELDEARNRLLEFNAQVEDAAQSKERIRISRQLHDDIGHRLIRIKMMMEAALQTLPTSPESGMQMLELIRDQLSASMDDMRSTVRRINYTPQLEGAYALDRLLEEIGRDTGIETSYQVLGIPYPLYPSIQVILYKNAREAITNALRHGKATAIWIKIEFSDAGITMEVSNNGILPEGNKLTKLPGSGGVGMKGMSERTHLIGGTLELRLEPHFTVVTRLPVYKQGEIV
ncbi:sensor histidine kinase [Paenibacillus sp.]|uniref:sensor histidine kinase n=1 Tax=Paenibacillus sp. TaxID=58172 RepID=UPI0028B0BB3C|nr:sensor histidine kinase [Paenibacillus sp.]